MTKRILFAIAKAKALEPKPPPQQPEISAVHVFRGDKYAGFIITTDSKHDQFWAYPGLLPTTTQFSDLGKAAEAISRTDRLMRG